MYFNFIIEVLEIQCDYHEVKKKLIRDKNKHRGVTNIQKDGGY